MKSRQLHALLAVALSALLSHGTVAAQASADAAGTGATTVAKLYGAWANAYGARVGAKVSYQGTGSGEGLRAAKARETAFGASDEPMTPAQLAAEGLVQIPTVVLGVVPVVNLPGVGKTPALQLDGVLLADIFAGKVAAWNDPRIAAINPQLSLPALPIKRIVNSQSSGTMGIFTGYLAGQSPEWRPLAGKKPKWPGDVKAGPGTDGMVKLLRSTPGAIAVVSYDRVQSQNLQSVALKNAAGQFVTASPETLVAAVKASGLRDNLNAGLLNVKGADVWPLTTLTYALFDGRPKSGSSSIEALRFFTWALTNGDRAVTNLGFLPLPPNVQASAFSALAGIRTADGSVPDMALELTQ